MPPAAADPGDAFERLHPAIQYHVVNSLGWKTLRPSQLAAIDPILEGRDCLVLAPTAGGKTEAAIVPLLSRACSEEWRGLTVLYVCPIKALLNNLEQRLSRYAALVGRTVQVWHGDVGQGAKARALREQPDILLTTPESLEAMLISLRVDRRAWFGRLRAVVIDELHAFAGDDRGWHLRAVLRRIDAYTVAPMQRIGLSATVGNPEQLLRWLVGHDRGVLVGESTPTTDADVVVDYVGTLANAVTVIARLHRGTKRLVFCDSRSKVEQVGAGLREQGVRTFVSHSSLSAAERRAAEQAFAEEADCVIVATSTLELGIDVGDLDHVIQIDSPATVSSFLQRMGRTGRRPGSRRNCTFLATSDDALLLACGVTRLWRERFVEAVVAPVEPWHLVAQQAMAIVLEQGAIPSIELTNRVAALFPELPVETVGEVLAQMRAEEILYEDAGVLAFGRRGELLFGRQHFIELVSSFDSPPLLLARHGAAEIGYVDPLSLQVDGEERPRVLLLGGRGWRVVSIEWNRKIVWVEPTADQGKSRWFGARAALGFPVCQAIRRELADDQPGPLLSRRGRERFTALREAFPAHEGDGTVLERLDGGRWRWWTFAGLRANTVLRQALAHACGPIREDDFGLEGQGTIDLSPAARAQLLASLDHVPSDVPAGPEADIKFGECLPQFLLHRLAGRRRADLEGARNSLSKPVLNLRS